jgi:tetratricopeptide (TPR) repeat protein
MRYLAITLIFAAALIASTKEVTLSLGAIDAVLGKIAPHAQNFPPQFSSVAERKKIEADLREALTLLDAALAQHPDDPEILFRDGYANAMGHNLDFDGCAQRYFKAFDRLLELQPESQKANYYYGAFLVATAARQKDGIRYLEKAVTLGVTDAHYTLAFAYTVLGDKKNALLHLKEYSKLHPDDDGAKKRITEMESADFRIVRHEGPPPGFDEKTKKKEPNQASEPTAPSGRGSP